MRTFTTRYLKHWIWLILKWKLNWKTSQKKNSVLNSVFVNCQLLTYYWPSPIHFSDNRAHAGEWSLYNHPVPPLRESLAFAVTCNSWTGSGFCRVWGPLSCWVAWLHIILHLKWNELSANYTLCKMKKKPQTKQKKENASRLLQIVCFKITKKDDCKCALMKTNWKIYENDFNGHRMS